MKQTILVTGGTGFIGSHTTVELIEAGYKVVIVDDLSNSKIEVLDGIEKITGVRPAFEKVDLRDKEATENVFKKYPEIEGIIHFAASKAVGESVQKVASLRNVKNLLSVVDVDLDSAVRSKFDLHIQKQSDQNHGHNHNCDDS